MLKCSRQHQSIRIAAEPLCPSIDFVDSAVSA